MKGKPSELPPRFNLAIIAARRAGMLIANADPLEKNRYRAVAYSRRAIALYLLDNPDPDNGWGKWEIGTVASLLNQSHTTIIYYKNGKWPALSQALWDKAQAIVKGVFDQVIRELRRDNANIARHLGKLIYENRTKGTLIQDIADTLIKNGVSL